MTDTIMKLLTDPLHWVGWVLTTGAIVGVFHLLKVHCLHTPIYNVLILLGIIVVIDVLKHKINLQ